jgi:tRNA-specific 2-thiouridylase
VHLKLWQDPRAPASAKILPSKCCTLQAQSRAKSVAKMLGVPFSVVSLEREFKKAVVDPFIAAYARGLTPNPCVQCNPAFKFAHLLKLAKKKKCDKVATGHYARLKEKTDAHGRKYVALLVAKDSKKDQSYYLYRLSDAERLRSLFPLGTLKKSAVYTLAKKWKIPLERASYRESQNLCFFPEKDALPFLKRYVRGSREGSIRTRAGKTVGMHRGLPFYTIGQRRGLKIGGLRIPLYVVEKRPRQNLLIVAPRGELRSNGLTMTQLHWIGPAPAERKKIPLDVRIRSLGERMPGLLVRTGKRATFRFARSAVGGIAPGQSAVLYRGEEIVGGGMITGSD